MKKINLVVAFLGILLLCIFVSCGGGKKESTRSDEDSFVEAETNWDSIRAEERKQKLERIAMLPPNKRYGNFDFGDTIYFGDLKIHLDSVVRTMLVSKSGSRIANRLTQNYSYDIYLSIMNTSDSIVMELPYVFLEKTEQQNVISQNSGDNSIFYLGFRMFNDEGTKSKKVFGTDNLIIKPHKTRRGYYHIVGQGVPDGIFFSFTGLNEGDELTIPIYYYKENMESHVKIKGNIIDGGEKPL